MSLIFGILVIVLMLFLFVFLLLAPLVTVFAFLLFPVLVLVFILVFVLLLVFDLLFVLVFVFGLVLLFLAILGLVLLIFLLLISAGWRFGLGGHLEIMDMWGYRELRGMTCARVFSAALGLGRLPPHVPGRPQNKIVTIRYGRNVTGTWSASTAVTN